MIHKIKHDTHYLGISLAILSTLFYSLMDVVVKYTVTYTYINYAVFYFQVNLFIILLLTVFGFSYMKMSLFKINVHPLIMLLRGSMSFIVFFLAFYILKLLRMDIYYAIVFTSPMIATLLATIFLKEKLRLVTIFSILLGTIGVLIINNPFTKHFDSKLFFPMCLTVCLAFSIACIGVITRRYLSTTKTLTISFYIFLICTIYGFVVALLQTNIHSVFYFDSSLFLYTLGSAVFCIFGNLLFVQAYRITPINIVAPTEYILIIWGVLFGYIFFNQLTTVPVILGASIVILGNVINTYNAKKTALPLPYE